MFGNVAMAAGTICIDNYLRESIIMLRDYREISVNVAAAAGTICKDKLFNRINYNASRTLRYIRLRLEQYVRICILGNQI